MSDMNKKKTYTRRYKNRRGAYNNQRRTNYRKRDDRIQMKGDKEVIKTGQPKVNYVIYRGIGIPSAFFTKLKYTETIALNTLPYEERIFRVNSVFDPYATGVGGQPMYHDQFSALYQRYVVLGCECQVTFTNRTNTTEAAFVKVGIYPQGSNLTLSDINEAIERDNCVYAQMGPNTGDQGIINMSIYGKPYAILGKSKFEKEDDTMVALVSANPVAVVDWHVFAGTNDATAVLNCYINVNLTYYVKYFDRVPVSRS